MENNKNIIIILKNNFVENMANVFYGSLILLLLKRIFLLEIYEEKTRYDEKTVGSPGIISLKLYVNQGL